jgi:hypothetical protein
MIALHWEETERDKDTVPLDVDWDAYRRFEREGIFRPIALRKGAKMIGYAAFHVHKMLHFRGLTAAVCDVIYVEPAHRGKAGLKLLRECERMIAELDERVRIVYGCKPYVHIGAKSGSLTQLLRHLGYRHDEDVLTKIVRRA